MRTMVLKYDNNRTSLCERPPHHAWYCPTRAAGQLDPISTHHYERELACKKRGVGDNRDNFDREFLVCDMHLRIYVQYLHSFVQTYRRTICVPFGSCNFEADEMSGHSWRRRHSNSHSIHHVLPTFETRS